MVRCGWPGRVVREDDPEGAPKDFFVFDPQPVGDAFVFEFHL